MHKINVATATDDQLRSWLKSTDIMIGAMRGSVLPYNVDQILNEEVDKEVVLAYTDLNINLAANGHLFDNDKQGFLGELMEDLYSKRKTVKGAMLGEYDEVEAIERELRRRGVEFKESE